MVKSVMDKVKKALEENGKYWIAFVGDSITSTEWVHPNWREIVEYVLKDKLQNEFDNWRIPSWGIRCFNWGFDGATTKDVLERIDMIIDHKPDMVIMIVGGNDSVKKISLKDHQKNILAVVKMLGKYKIGLVYGSDTKPWNDKAREKYEPFVEVDRNLRIKNFIDMYKESASFPCERIYTFKSEAIPEENVKKGDRDNYHPNQLGNAYIAKIILDKIFGIKFDPEKYIKTTEKGYKYPEY